MGLLSSSKKTKTTVNSYEYDLTDESQNSIGLEIGEDSVFDGVFSPVNLRDSSENNITTTDYGSVASAIGLSNSIVNAQAELTNNFLNSAEKLALQTQGQALEYNQSATQNALKFADNALKSDQGETAGLIKWASGLAALVLMSFAFVKSKG